MAMGLTGNERKLNEAAPHIWWTMHCSERDRSARLAKDLLAAGVAERQVQVAQEQARIAAGVLTGTVAALLALVLELADGTLEESELRGRVRGVIEAAWREQVPGVLRAQIGLVTGAGGVRSA